MFIVAREAW